MDRETATAMDGMTADGNDAVDDMIARQQWATQRQHNGDGRHNGNMLAMTMREMSATAMDDMTATQRQWKA